MGKRYEGRALLNELTNIYQQLDQLERSMDRNFMEHRTRLMKKEMGKLSTLENQLEQLEGSFVSYEKDKVALHYKLEVS